MALSHQFGKAASKSASEMAAELDGRGTDKKSDERREVISPKAPMVERSHTNEIGNAPVHVERTGDKKAWGPRIDTAILDLVKRNSKNQTQDAEEMILLFAAMKGWT